MSIAVTNHPGRGLRRLVACLVVFGLSASCRSTGPSGSGQLSERAVVLGVPVLYQDELYECGLASVSALCQFYGRSIPVEEGRRLARTAEREGGLSGSELREVLEGMDLEVFIFRGGLDDSVSGLFHHIDHGRPLLVMISEDGEDHHYCLVTGYDRETDSIVVVDPRRGHLVFPTAGFHNLWERSGFFSLLCVPEEGIDW